MKVMRISLIAPILLVFFCSGAGAQGPPLPFEVDGPQPEQLGQNSFGRPIALRAIHNESVPTPVLDPLLPPNLPQIPRYYITIRYYACRPWFIHPYTGATLRPQDLFENIQTDNPDSDIGSSGLDGNLQVDPRLGEPRVCVFDDGLIDENNPDAVRDWQDEQEVEIENAANVGVSLNTAIRPIWHAPYYGLYCLRIRICVPLLGAAPGNVFNYWVKWRYHAHQRYCWRTWWHRCWFNHPTLGWYIRAWRPMCNPCVFWFRAGPDWIMNICSVNRYRHWCLYGFRYYCRLWTNAVFINHPSVIGDLRLGIQPLGAGLTTGWLRPWPYPPVRYWPFRPYCTRWFWFRPLPWVQYRWLPPLVNTGIAAPDAAHGAGFVEVAPTPEQQQINPNFPLDPPGGLDGNGNFPNRAQPDSFFDIFLDLGECRYRAAEEQNGDHNSDGSVGNSDNPRPNRLTERGEVLNDTRDDGFPSAP